MQDVPEGFKDNVSSIYLEYGRVWKSFHTAEVCSLVCFNFHQFVAFSQLYTVWKCTVLNFNLFFVSLFFMTVYLNAYSGCRTLCDDDVRLAVSTKCMNRLHMLRWTSMDEQALSELLECSVCLERLDHTSKVLPCQHTFCRRCLEEILSTQQELRCPECRTLVTIRVEDLPPNILLVRLLEGLKTQGLVLSSKPSSYQRKRDTSADSRQQQSSRAGWDVS